MNFDSAYDLVGYMIDKDVVKNALFYVYKAMTSLNHMKTATLD